MERGVATAKVDSDPGQTLVVDASKLAFVVGVKPVGRDTTGSGRHTTPPARYFYPATHETGVAISAAAKTPTHTSPTAGQTLLHFHVLHFNHTLDTTPYPQHPASTSSPPAWLAHMGRVSCRHSFYYFGLGYTPISAPTTATREWWAWALGWARTCFFWRTDMVVMVDIKGQHTVELLRFNKLSNRGTDGEGRSRPAKKELKQLYSLLDSRRTEEVVL